MWLKATRIQLQWRFNWLLTIGAHSHHHRQCAGFDLGHTRNRLNNKQVYYWTACMRVFLKRFLPIHSFSLALPYGAAQCTHIVEWETGSTTKRTKFNLNCLEPAHALDTRQPHLHSRLFMWECFADWCDARLLLSQNRLTHRHFNVWPLEARRTRFPIENAQRPGIITFNKIARRPRSTFNFCRRRHRSHFATADAGADPLTQSAALYFHRSIITKGTICVRVNKCRSASCTTTDDAVAHAITSSSTMNLKRKIM